MVESFVVFQVNGTNYAVRSDQVQQIAMIEKITPVPNAPSFVEGIVYLRGQVVPVINLRRRFDLEKVPYDLRSRLIVIQLEKRVIGMAADSARQFMTFEDKEIQPPPESLSGPGVEYLEGVVSRGGDLYLVIDLYELLSEKEKTVLNENDRQYQPAGSEEE